LLFGKVRTINNGVKVERGYTITTNYDNDDNSTQSKKREILFKFCSVFRHQYTPDLKHKY